MKTRKASIDTTAGVINKSQNNNITILATNNFQKSFFQSPAASILDIGISTKKDICMDKNASTNIALGREIKSSPELANTKVGIKIKLINKKYLLHFFTLLTSNKFKS